jgi:hypothetical protein
MSHTLTMQTAVIAMQMLVIISILLMILMILMVLMILMILMILMVMARIKVVALTWIHGMKRSMAKEWCTMTHLK